MSDIKSLCTKCENSSCSMQGTTNKFMVSPHLCASGKGPSAPPVIPEREPDYDDDDYDPMGFGFGWTQP